MNKTWKVFKSEKEWLGEGEPDDSYIVQNNRFDFTCKKCKSKAVMYTEYACTYEISNLLKCTKCNVEEYFYTE